MKPYVVTTGIVFALITAAHGFRIAVEPHVVREPVFVLTSLLSLGLCVWAFVLVFARRS